VAHRQSPDGLVLKATLLFTSTLTVMAAATIAPALPAMQDHFAASPNVEFWVRLVLTLPALFIVIGAPLAGNVVDRFGRKRLLIIAAFLYGFAGASGFVADSLPLILLGRAALGLAVAGLMTSVTTLIADYYDGPARAQFMGIQAAFMGLGGTVFLTVGGLLADMDWRAPFLIYLFAFLVLPFIITVLYEPERDNPPMQRPLAGPADSTAEKLSTPAGPALDTDTGPSPDEAAPVRLMVFIYGSMILIQTVFYFIPVQLPFYLAELVGATAAASGLAIAGLALFFSLASMLFGWLDKHLGHLTAMVLAFGLVGIGYLLIGQAGDWTLVVLGLPVAGFGIGLLVPNLNVWLANASPLRIRGRALSGITTSVFLGQFLSPFASQPVGDGLGYAGMYGAAGVLMVLLAGTVLLLRRRLLAWLEG
jgi:MFS family permease